MANTGVKCTDIEILTKKVLELEYTIVWYKRVVARSAITSIVIICGSAAQLDGAKAENDVEAKSIRIKNDDKQIVAELVATGDSSQFSMMDSKGIVRFRLSADYKGTGPAMLMYGSDGMPLLIAAGYDERGGGKIVKTEQYLTVYKKSGAAGGVLGK